MRAQKNAKPFSRFAKSLRTVWRALREWCGDAAYERYLSSRAIRSSVQTPLTAKEFYVERVNRRYSRPNRCC